MSEGTVLCPRCDASVGDLRFVPPDLITRDLIADIDSNEGDSTGKEGLEVCEDCFADFEGG